MKHKNTIQEAEQRGRAKALLDASKILHQYAMRTIDTPTLDLIERMQKEILELINYKYL